MRAKTEEKYLQTRYCEGNRGQLLLAGPALAQVPGDEEPGGTGPAPGGGATGVPIDGGASLLLAGGVAYDLRRLRQRRVRQAWDWLEAQGA